MITWTDARRLVPRLWIRSAEVRGERRREHNNNINGHKCNTYDKCKNNFLALYKHLPLLVDFDTQFCSKRNDFFFTFEFYI